MLAGIEERIPTPERETGRPPLLYVARSFDVNKPGTPPESLVGGVIGGAVVQGKFRVGDEIEIRPGLMVGRRGERIEYEPLVTEIESLRFGDVTVEEALPGGLVAIGTTLDPSVTKSDNLVGSVVGRPGSVPETLYEVEAEYSLLERVVGMKQEVRVEPIRPGEMLMVTVGTAISLGQASTVDKEKLSVKLRRPVSVWPGARMALSRRVHGRWRLIGWGVVK